MAVACCAELMLGKPLAFKDPMSLAMLLAHPSEYAGKTVLMKGRISAVCQMMGCWMDLTNDDGHKIRPCRLQVCFNSWRQLKFGIHDLRHGANPAR